MAESGNAHEIVAVDHVARSDVRVALARIEAHEKSCEERMDAIKGKFDVIHSGQRWVVRSLFTAALTILAGIIVSVISLYIKGAFG